MGQVTVPPLGGGMDTGGDGHGGGGVLHVTDTKEVLDCDFLLISYCSWAK